MDICQQRLPFLFRDAEELYPALTPPVDVSIHQDVHLGLPGDSIRFGIVFREYTVSHVPEQVHGPGRGRPFCDHDVRFAGGSPLPGL